MSRIGAFFRQLVGLQQASTPSSTPSTIAGLRYPSAVSTSPLRDYGRYAEGDRVLISRGKNWLEKLEGPLRRDGNFKAEGGKVYHNHIIGNKIGKVLVRNSEGRIVFVNYPSLDGYISKTPRLVTPIYASYAASIVDLLDIHPSPWAPASDRLEILDAGTGHGSLAMHLARAVASANPPFPDSPLPDVQAFPDSKNGSTNTTNHTQLLSAWTDYQKSRKAIVHTIDISPKISAHAEKIIRGFRQGIYWPHINFYAGPVKEWAKTEVTKRGGFLSYALLDLPDVQNSLASIAAALLTDGKLAVFAPSITQIGECERVVQDNDLPLKLLEVHELGEGISTGRDWDVRSVTPRARERVEQREDDTASSDDEDGSIESNDDDVNAPSVSQKVWVMRPRVGKRVVGGGFVGLWRKKRDKSCPDEGQAEVLDDRNGSQR